MIPNPAELTQGDPLPTVRYSFEAEGSTSAWRIFRLDVREELSRPFSATLDLVSELGGAVPSDLVGRSCTVTLDRGGLERRLSGVIHRIEHVGAYGDQVLTRVDIAPALLALEHRVTSRVFQDLPVPEIVRRVLEAGLQPFQRALRLALARSYSKREYCVQYGESDLAFVSRLLEDEGIFYWFDHSGPREEMVLQDASAASPPFREVSVVPLAGTGASLASVEALREFTYSRAVVPSRVTVREFDWTRPALDLTASDGATEPAFDAEVYDHDLALRTVDYDQGRGTYDSDDGAVRAQLRLEELRAAERLAAGSGYVTGLTPGTTFDLINHSIDVDGKYLVVSVSHRGEARDALGESIEREPLRLSDARDRRREDRYSNDFRCISADRAFRPNRRTRARRIHGLQSAVVVGPPGEEIHTDQHGRIKVRFPWDREASGDDKSSCWIRVAQVWSGPGWGFSFIPRIGMEVLVAFVEGDPDRPLVVGCAFNGANPPPYSLPAEKTKSTIRTSSSPGGGGYNELRFEDAAGSEEVFVHAQKDMNVVVEHRRSLTVRDDDTHEIVKNQSISVGVNLSESIGADESRSVGANFSESVGANATVSIGGNRTETVGGAAAETVALEKALTIGGAYQVSVGAVMNETVGGIKAEEVAGAKMVNVGAASSENVAGNKSLNVGGNVTIKAAKNLSASAVDGATTRAGKKMVFDAGDELVIKCGEASITLKKNGDIAIKGKKIVVKGSNDVVVKGPKVAGN